MASTGRSRLPSQYRTRLQPVRLPSPRLWSSSLVNSQPRVATLQRRRRSLSLLFLFARTSTTRCWDRDVVRCCFGSRVDERTVKRTGWGHGLGPTVPGGLGRDPSGTVISRVGTGGRVLCTLLGGLRQRGPSEHTRYLGLSTGKRIFQWDNNEPDLDFGLTAFASLQQRTRKKKKDKMAAHF
ncbi:hypothetical protein HPB47_009783 [Ixodes persulcatus]|uniref:Uncharacterized protein n=1 Tax=Ixodes persulcatus TaxID=34615 RepID=A0AC60P157_IXOPE|nr:hypothetical protein HPB47_009783 [Ixodes persulcatus]